jgi:DNA-binding NarL/FixJ family response regulator
MGPIRVLLAEDHNVVREGLRLLLNAQPDIRVIGEATNGRQAVALARENCPDVAVLDISMPDLDGLQAASLIRAECPRTQVLILTMHESDA